MPGRIDINRGAAVRTRAGFCRSSLVVVVTHVSSQYSQYSQSHCRVYSTHPSTVCNVSVSYLLVDADAVSCLYLVLVVVNAKIDSRSGRRCVTCAFLPVGGTDGRRRGFHYIR